MNDGKAVLNHREKQPVDNRIHRSKWYSNLCKLEEGNCLPEFMLRILDDDNIAGGTEDGEITGNRGPGGQCHQFSRGYAEVHQYGHVEGYQRYIRDELAEHDTDRQDDHYRSQVQVTATDERLEYPGVPNTLHQDEHRRKKDKGKPIDVFYDGKPLGAEDDNGEGCGQCDISQSKINICAGKNENNFHYY